MEIILYYDKNDETIRFAAEELSHYMKAVGCSFGGADGALPFHLLSEGKAVSDPDDSFSVSVSQKEGTITGCNSRGVLLGVYAYLRKLGFRFLLPGKTYIPELTDASMFLTAFSHRPSLRHRGVCIEGADSLENVLDFVDWLPKAGFNSFFLQFKEPYIFLQRWYEHVFNPVFKSAHPDEAFYQSCYRQMTDAVRKRSLLLHTAGHGWTCEVMGQPSIGWVETNDQPSEDTKGLLALVNGKREFIDRIPMNTNLCYSNPQAVDQFCGAVLSYIKTHPHTDYLHIWLGDEPNHICECEECKKSTPTDQYVRILNEIDDRLTARGLSCRLVFLLYQELLYPPVKERLKHPERFLLLFAPISRTFQESYPNQIQAVPLPEYRRNHMTLPVSIEENLSYLKGWQEQYRASAADSEPEAGSAASLDSIDYDYPLGRAHYGDFGYVGISRVLAGDIKSIHRLGLNGYMSCQELRAFLPNGLPNYVMGRVLNNREEDFDDIAREYFQAAYGSDYLWVLDYLTWLSELSDCDYFNKIGPRVNPKVCSRYQKLLTVLEEASAHIREVEAGLCGQTLHLFFWKLLDYHAEYSVRLTRALIARSAGDLNASKHHYLAFCEFIRSREALWQPYLDVYRIIEVSGKYTGLSFPKPDAQRGSTCEP